MNGISHIAALNGLPVPPQNPPDTDAISYKLAADYMKFKLSTVGYVWPNGIETPDDMECAQAKKDMRALGAEFEQRYADVFDNMVESLQITPNSLFPTFMGVTDELFADGIRWGRIVGLYAFAGNLAVECMHHNMPHMVASLIHWVSHYVETRLADWIAENEGWVKLNLHCFDFHSLICSIRMVLWRFMNEERMKGEAGEP